MTKRRPDEYVELLHAGETIRLKVLKTTAGSRYLGLGPTTARVVTDGLGKYADRIAAALVAPSAED